MKITKIKDLIDGWIICAVRSSYIFELKFRKFEQETSKYHLIKDEFSKMAGAGMCFQVLAAIKKIKEV